jgi:Biopolymer transport protein ExbD/TolR
MAGIDVGGGHGKKRSVNQEIPLIPFIDFLLCLVSFLLITAVWTQMSRINADARVPGPPDPDRELEEQKKDLTLHVEMRGEEKFQLVWKEGNTVMDTIDVPRKAVPLGTDDFGYPDLSTKIVEQWGQRGSHRADSDLKRDQAVLHTDNTTKFEDIIAVIDSIYAPQREIKLGAAVEQVPAFNVTFSVN